MRRNYSWEVCAVRLNKTCGWRFQRCARWLKVCELPKPGRVDTRPRKRPLYRRPAFLIAAVIVLLVAAAVGLRYWLYARSHESTDDAFIDAHLTPISPTVSGY